MGCARLRGDATPASPSPSSVALHAVQSSTGSYLKLDPARPHILSPKDASGSQVRETLAYIFLSRNIFYLSISIVSCFYTHLYFSLPISIFSC